MTQTLPLNPAELETNQAGRLTDSQRQSYRTLARSFRKNEFVGALFCAAIAAILLTATGPAPSAQYRPLASAAFLLAAVFFVARATVLGDSVSQDVRSGKVEMVEGAVGKRRVSSNGSISSFYYLTVAGKSFSVGIATYEATPEAGIVRLYYLPRSHKVVNLERMPDRPVPDGALSSPAQLIGTLASAMRSHDSVQANEARAELEAVKDKFAAMATPPSADQRDPRPLQQAILGTWQMGPMSMTFMPDGTMVATIPNGVRRQGRWSIGADGKLHADATGTDQAAEAWVSGDMLTLSDGQAGMSYHRVAGPAGGSAG